MTRTREDMMGSPISLERVADGDIPIWAHLSVATVATDADEAKYAAEFAHAPTATRERSYLAWQADSAAGRQAVARLRLVVHGERAITWSWGLSPAARWPGREAALIGAVEAEARARGARVLTIAADAGRRRAVERAGFRLARTRIGMAAAIVARPVVCGRLLRYPRPADERDVQALGRLYYDAYHGTIDDEGESPADSLAQLRQLLAGELGPFLPDCSWVVEGDGHPAGAVLVTDDSDDTALVAEVMVAPRYRGQGYARPMLQAAMNACLERGWNRLVLMVTRGNVPAEGLYRRMGFVEEPGFEEYHMEKELGPQP